MRTYLSILGAVGVLSACSLMPGIRQNVDQAIIGKPVQHAVDVLGLPTQENTIVGRHLVVWKNRSCTLTAEIQDGMVKKYDLIDGDPENIACYSWLRTVK